MNSIANSSLFVYKSETEVLYVLVYVDDILLTGTNASSIAKMQDLNDQFALKTLDP